jgi:adenylylsulfate kinase
LDGDAVRDALRPRPGYSERERDEFYETLANLAAELARQGLVVLVPATAHRASFRQRARSLAPDFVEVFVQASEREVRERDAKGLYRAALEGRAEGVPGADLEYEAPAEPDVRANGGRDDAAIDAIVRRVRPAGA